MGESSCSLPRGLAARCIRQPHRHKREIKNCLKTRYHSYIPAVILIHNMYIHINISGGFKNQGNGQMCIYVGGSFLVSYHFFPGDYCLSRSAKKGGSMVPWFHVPPGSSISRFWVDGINKQQHTHTHTKLHHRAANRASSCNNLAHTYIYIYTVYIHNICNIFDIYIYICMQLYIYSICVCNYVYIYISQEKYENRPIFPRTNPGPTPCQTSVWSQVRNLRQSQKILVNWGFPQEEIPSRSLTYLEVQDT